MQAILEPWFLRYCVTEHHHNGKSTHLKLIMLFLSYAQSNLTFGLNTGWKSLVYISNLNQITKYLNSFLF